MVFRHCLRGPAVGWLVQEICCGYHEENFKEAEGAHKRSDAVKLLFVNWDISPLVLHSWVHSRRLVQEICCGYHEENFKEAEGAHKRSDAVKLLFVNWDISPLVLHSWVHSRRPGPFLCPDFSKLPKAGNLQTAKRAWKSLWERQVLATAASP